MERLNSLESYALSLREIINIFLMKFFSPLSESIRKILSELYLKNGEKNYCFWCVFFFYKKNQTHRNNIILGVFSI